MTNQHICKATFLTSIETQLGEKKSIGKLQNEPNVEKQVEQKNKLDSHLPLNMFHVEASSS